MARVILCDRKTTFKMLQNILIFNLSKREKNPPQKRKLSYSNSKGFLALKATALTGP